MLQDFNIIVTEEANWFVGSDYHCFHNKDFIIGPRGHTDVNKYNEWLIESHNSRVRAQDDFLFLGDFLVGAGQNAWEKGNEIISRLNGNIFMLFGNHNSFISQLYRQTLTEFLGMYVRSEDKEYLKSIEIYPLTHYHYSGKKITFLGKFVEGNIKIEPPDDKSQKQNYRYTASHYPISSWPELSRGSISLSGHEHSNLNDWSPFELHKGKKLDCGVDNAIKYNSSPVFSMEEVIKIMSKKQYLGVGHHKKEEN